MDLRRAARVYTAIRSLIHHQREADVAGPVWKEEVMGGLGAPELMIILLIVIVLFGASRLAGIGGALGNSVREFRKSVKEDDAPPPQRG